MKRNFKKIVLLSMTCLFAFTFAVQANAAAKKERQAAMKAYDAVLKGDMDDKLNVGEGGGFTSESFHLMDINKDGMPELVINASKDSQCLQLLTYTDGKIVLLYNSWTLGEFSYSSKTKAFMHYSLWNGRESVAVYRINKDKSDVERVYSAEFENKKYTESKVKDGKFENKKITKKTYDANIKKFMPEKKVIQFPYQNTKTNRAKYLK